MSAIRDPATITKTGRQMVTAGGDITYTKAVLYGQDISHLTKEQVEGLTSIGDPLVTVPIGISDKNDDGNGTTVVLEATFQNSNLKADLPYKAVGFFAKKDDGDEKLVLVGVATDGAYLAATSPDGVSTDSLDIKIAVAVGDASNVTAVVDPAGSVTPATLNGAISKATHDLTDKINTKADKTDLDSQIGIVTKSVSDLSDTVKANKDDTDKALATKADKATVESDLATKASQSDLDKTNAKVATKADSEDVNAQLATKANSKDVNDALALKDDTADVDDKISNVTKSVSDLSATVTANKKATDSTLAIKANASDVADGLATKADKTDVASDVKSLNDAINTKASQADLDKTNAVVATKANATALADYARTVDVDADLDTKANKTDLESLAKTADVNSALDTKADKATVNSDIKTINDTMATKADKTTVDGDVKTLQASIDTKADKTALDDYAKSADVASDVKTLTDSIATKADAKTVNDAISKIDLTPYAKSADVDSKLKGYTDTADLTKLLAGKADSDFSYSKAELDKKLLDLTTTTGGKVDASQVATMIENKADKSDVTKQIGTVTDLVNTKANSTDVTAALDKKDDITDVDAKIKTVTDAVNIKANSSDVNNQITSINKALSQLIPDETYAPELSAGFDLNSSFVGWRRSVNKKLKNAPFGWVNDMIIFQGTVAGADGRFELALYIGDTESTNPKIAYRYFGWNTWKPWVLLADNGDISDVRNQISANVDKLNQAINTKANSSDVYTKGAVDTALGQRDSKITNLQNSALQVIEGHAGDDILSFRDDKVRVYSNCQNVKNLPLMGNEIWFYTVTRCSHGWGSVTVISQDNCYWQNVLNGDTWAGWTKHATSADIDNLTNQINQKANSSDVDSKIKTVTDLANAKANSSDVYTKSQVDSKTSGTIITHFDVASMTPTKESNSYNARWLVDQLALADLASQINQLKGRRTVDQADFNSLTDSGVYYVSIPKTNNPVQQWGTLVVSNGNSNRLSQLYYPDDNSAPWYRTLNGSTWKSWVQLATASQVSDAKNTATQANNGLASKANSSDVTALQSKVNVNSSLYRMIGDNDTWLKIFGVNNNDTPVLTSLRLQGGTGPLLGNFAAGVGFGGADTKGVLSVAYADHQARITGGNGDDPVWSEDIAWKSDINSTNQTVSALQQTIKTLNDTLSSANATIKTLQDTITGLQTQVSNQANEISYIKANYIEGKRFAKADESQATAWEKENSQRIAFITDN